MHNFYHRASVSLNNTGVSLAEGGYFADALKTLAEAVKVADAEIVICYQQVISSLHTANQRTAILAPLKSVYLDSVSHNQADYVSTQPSGAFALIRIEEDTDELDMDLVYAIMLSNLSLLILCSGKATYAVGCLQLAHRLLDHLFQRYHGQGAVFLLKRVAHLSTIVLSTLMMTLGSIGQAEDAERVGLELYYLYQLTSSLDDTGLFPSRAILPASAA
jgi:hypothetical protein